MRRLLPMLCAAALSVSVLGALPAEAAAPTWLYVYTSDPLLNENGDGYWESATVTVSTHADTAHWALSTGGQVVAEADLTEQQLQDASHARGQIEVSSTAMGTTLAAGTYTVTVTATESGAEPSTLSTNIYVSTSGPLTSLIPSATVIYPDDYYPGVAHEVTFRHGLDATVAEWASPRFDLVGADGVRGPWTIDQQDPLLRWAGQAPPPGGGTSVSAPSGTYRARLEIRDNGVTTYGPLSQPFTLSRRYREPVESTTSRPANATRTATLTKRHARVRARNGSLRYRAYDTDWRSPSLVRTAHRVRVPRDRVPDQPVFLVVRGRWQHDLDIDLEIVTPKGRVRNIDVYASVSRRALILSIPRRWIRADGTVKFRLLWRSFGVTGAPGRTGLTDTVGLRVHKYVWRGGA